MSIEVIVGVIAFVTIVILFITGKGNSSSRPSDIPEHPTDENVKGFLRAGQKIKAIKCYRYMHGVGLKDAKEAVEAMELD